MSYLVMARRWRPQKFSDVIGQSHVTRTLQKAISKGRVAHAYILTGPRGIGKTTIARLMAKAVNCTNPQTDENGLIEPCNECDACKDITDGGSMDVSEIDGASNNKVEDVRKLRENIRFVPTSLKRKVYIIDEVHMLSNSAFNALLKTLEEPPDHAMFIFATTEIHKVPQTVLSRCQRFDLKRIAPKEIRVQLEKIIAGDNLIVDEDALTTISLRAEGALRDALSILDQLVAFQGDEPITGEVVRQALAMIGPDFYFRATDMAASGKVGEALGLSDDLGAGGHDAREFLRGFQRHVLNFLLLKAGNKSEEIDAAEHFRKQYEDRVNRLSDEDYLRMGEWAAEAEDALREVLDPRIRLELFLVKLSRMDRAVDLGALLERMGLEPESFKAPIKQVGAPVQTPPDDQMPTPEAPPQPEPPEQQAPPVGEPQPPFVDERDSLEKVTVEAQEDIAETEAPVTHIEESVEDQIQITQSEQEPETEKTDQDQPTLDNIRVNWLKIGEKLSSIQPGLGDFFEVGAPVLYDEYELTIAFNPDKQFNQNKVNQAIETVRSVFSEMFSGDWKIKLKSEIIPDSMLPPRRKSPKELRRDQFNLMLEDRPVWKDMMKRFDLDLEDE